MTRTRIKMCGITRPEDAAVAANAGVDAIGLVFWQGSKRAIDLSLAREVRDVVPPLVAVVGVFVDASADEIRRVHERAGISLAQVCGKIAGDGWDDLPRSLGLLRAIGIDGQKAIEVSLRMNGVSDYIVDSGSHGQYGGTGETFDWRLVEPVRDWGRIWLAGGLTPANVGEAIKGVRPHAVDVSTGVELSPGVKSTEKIRAFVDAVHHADHALAKGEKSGF